MLSPLDQKLVSNVTPDTGVLSSRRSEGDLLMIKCQPEEPEILWGDTRA